MPSGRETVVGKLFLKGTIYVKGLSATECMEILREKIDALHQFRLGERIEVLRRFGWQTMFGREAFGGYILGPNRIRFYHWRLLFSNGWHQMLNCNISDCPSGCRIDYRGKVVLYVLVFSFIWVAFWMTALVGTIVYEQASSGMVVPFGMLLIFGAIMSWGWRMGRKSATIARDKLKEWLGEYNIEDIEE